MLKKMVFLGGLLLTLPVWAADNECIRCHEGLTRPLVAAHNFKDWKNSIHARAEVSCEACHQGDSKAKDPVKAHAGVKSTQDPKSSIHFQKVSETCGACHVAEFGEFKKSAHYRTLLRTGKGPNCLTCHGTMATTVLHFSDLDQTCSFCHGKPAKAAQTFNLIRSAKNALDVFKKQKGADPKKVTEFMQRYAAIQQHWHSFDVEGVADEAQNLIHQIQDAEKSKP